MFAGQMGCEALNWVLKRYIKEERPRGKKFGHSSWNECMLMCCRNAWKGLRNALIACPIRHLLLRHASLLPPLPTRPSPDRDAYALDFLSTLRPLYCWPFLSSRCSIESHISELSHAKAGPRRMRSRRDICCSLVRFYHLSKTSRVGGMGFGNRSRTLIPREGSSRAGRPC